MLRKIGYVLALVMSLVLWGCAGSTTSESTGQYLDSAAITTKVKASLVDELSTKGFAIQVKTYKDTVQLSGFVESPVTKQRAGRIAAGVDNVRRVINDIVIK